MLSRRNALAEFYTKWGDLMSAISDMFTQWARDAYWRSGELYYQEAVSLGEVVRGLLPDEMVLDDAPDDHPGFHRPALRFDPARDSEAIQVFVFGTPTVGEVFGIPIVDDDFDPGEPPHGDEAPV